MGKQENQSPAFYINCLNSGRKIDIITVVNIFKRLIPYYKPHIKLFLLDLFCALIIAAVDTVFPAFTQYIVRILLPEMAVNPSLLSLFIILIVAALIAYAVRTVMMFVMNYWGHIMGVAMEADIRRDLFDHIQTLQFSFYDRTRTGKLLSRITSDIFEITELAHHGPENMIISILTIVGSFIAMFIIEWRIALSMLVVLPFMIAFILWARIRQRESSMEVKENTASINADIESSISGARVAKAFTNEEYEKEKFNKGNTKFIHAKDKFYKYMAYFNSGTELFLGLFSIIVLAVGGVLIYKNLMDPLILITFMLYVSALSSPVKRLAAFAEQYYLGMAGFSRFCELMDVQPDIVDRPDAVELDSVIGDIEFHDVTFAYNDGKDVLSKVNLKIKHGTKVALVGPSGSGKTTMCHLIPRFYEIQDGSITIDGKDIRDVTMRSLRKNIGIVQQDVFLFAASVKENIRYGRLDATDEEVFEAAKRARIHEEILTFVDGYNTAVGERGIMLSGGQKQRIAIARLFLKNPPILILDEATSSLDTITEADIQKSFDDLSTGRTTIVIAHRLSTVKNADEIVVIDQNGIRERGTHKQLIEQGGVYAGLYNLSVQLN